MQLGCQPCQVALASTRLPIFPRERKHIWRFRTNASRHRPQWISTKSTWRTVSVKRGRQAFQTTLRQPRLPTFTQRRSALRRILV